MEIRELNYFIAVAECGSISKAAQKLFITQPNLSRQLQKLEEELGQKLLIRSNKSTELSDAGKLLYKRAKEITELASKTREEISSDSGELVGTVSIGGGESYAVELIARAAKETISDHPGIKFDFFSGDTDAVTDKLDKGLIDFGILIDPSDLTKYNSLRLPLKDTWGILARNDSPVAYRSCVTPKDLKDLPLIFSVHSFKKNAITEWFGIDPEKLNVVATYNLLYNASLMVKQGIGYAVGLDKIVGTSSDSGLKFIPFEPKLETHLDVAWKKSTVLSRTSETFLKYLKNTLAEY